MRVENEQSGTASTLTLIVGGLVLLAVGFGWWLGRRTAGGSLAGLSLGPVVAPPAFLPYTSAPAPRAAPAALAAPARRAPMVRDTSGRPPVEYTPAVEAFTVSSEAIEVVSRSAAGSRRVRIATDQPIRLANGKGIATDPSRGLPIMPGEQPYDLGVLPPNARFFAVVPLGGVAANVTVFSQLVEG